MDIFGITLEFDHDAVRQRIARCRDERGKGYVCIVDGPSLARSRADPEFRALLRGACFNSCDGGTIASMASRLYRRPLRAFTGPEIFAEFVGRSDFRQVLLGNTEQTYARLLAKLSAEGRPTAHLSHLPLPFAPLEAFDYEGIARRLARLDADLVWVSLGAPKQEFFMRRLLPHMERGMLLGVGAAFAFYLGDLRDYTFRLGECRFNWLYRIVREPRKQLRRIGQVLLQYPALYLEERRRRDAR